MKIALSIYGVIMALMVVVGLFVSGVSSPGETIVRTILSLIQLFGLYGYITNTAYIKRGFWVAMSYLMVLGTVVTLASVGANPTLGIITISLFIPLIIALFKYSSKTNPIWPEEKEVANKTTGAVIQDVSGKANHLITAFLKNSVIHSTAISEVNGIDVKTTVTLTKKENEYDSLIEVDGVELKSLSTPSIEKIVTFIEENSNIAAYDY